MITDPIAKNDPIGDYGRNHVFESCSTTIDDSSGYPNAVAGIYSQTHAYAREYIIIIVRVRRKEEEFEGKLCEIFHQRREPHAPEEGLETFVVMVALMVVAVAFATWEYGELFRTT